MKLLCASGMGTPDADPDRLYQVLLESATLFLRGGGQVSLDEWATLDNTERAAMVAAGNQIRVEQALVTARAVFDPDYGAKAEGEAFNDLTHERFRFRKLVDRVITNRFGRSA